jgi:hypothetical protein
MFFKLFLKITKELLRNLHLNKLYYPTSFKDTNFLQSQKF